MTNYTIDKWIQSRLKKTISLYNDRFENYEYAKAREVVENFFWNDYCDNYLEITKIRSYGINAFKYEGIDLSETEKIKIEEGQKSVDETIYKVYNAVLKLFAPFLPHVTEEIYSVVYEEEFMNRKSISARGNAVKEEEFEYINENSVNILLDILGQIRKYKSEQKISIKTEIENIKIYLPIDLEDNLIEDLKNVCSLRKIEFIKSKEVKIEC